MASENINQIGDEDILEAAECYKENCALYGFVSISDYVADGFCFVEDDEKERICAAIERLTK